MQFESQRLKKKIVSRLEELLGLGGTHTFNPSALEAEAGGLLQVPGQPRVCRKPGAVVIAQLVGGGAETGECHGMPKARQPGPLPH